MIKISLLKNIDPSILDGRATKLEQKMAKQVMEDTREFVPADTLSLDSRTYVIGNKIVYPGPYARFLWYGMRMVNALTGKGPMYIPNVGWRWPKGATLRATDTPLHISTAVHKHATSHWMDASISRNMKKWEKIAARYYTDG